MAIRKTPQNGSTHAGAQGGNNARRDLISLSMTPVKQGLTFYAEINRSILDTFLRFIPLGMSSLSSVGERNGLQSAAAVEPGTAAETQSRKLPAEPPAVKRSTATKRPATTKATATKRPATTKAAATKGVAKRRPAAPPPRAMGQSAAQKRAGKAAPKPAVKSAGRVKPSAAKKVASSRPRAARASASRKA